MYNCADMQNALGIIRQKLGHGKIKNFVENELNVRYRTFVYQCEHGVVPYKTIKLLIDKLDIDFKDFKVYEFNDVGKSTPLSESASKLDDKKAEKAAEQLEIPMPMKLSELLGNK